MTIPRIQSYTMPTAAELPRNKVNWQPEPSRSALLIHDMQSYFCHFYADDCPLLHQLIANIRQLRDYAYHHGIPVIYTAQPAEQSSTERALLNDMWGPGLTAADANLAAIIDALQPQAQDIVLTKWRYSAFAKSPLQALLAELGRDQLIICGIYAHIGIQTTAVDAFMRDIQPFVIADAVADFDQQQHLQALHYLAGRAAVVLHTAAFTIQPSPGIPPVLDAYSLTDHVLQLIMDDVEHFSADANLLDYGIDSVQIMQLVALWRSQGLLIEFADLAAEPTLNAWLQLLEQRRSPSNHNTAALERGSMV
jgi:bifunctional isochorismate lyase/aryl carrier protein